MVCGWSGFFIFSSVLQAASQLREPPPRPTLLKQSALGHEIAAADVVSLCLNRCGKRGHAYAKFTPRSQRGAKPQSI